MIRRFAPLPLLCALGACSSNKPPCTDCPEVAATYLEDSQPAEASCGEGVVLIWTGGTGVAITVTQTGSELRLVRRGIEDGMDGTLYEDLSADFGPLQRQLSTSDGSFVTGTVMLHGTFSPGRSPAFNGTWKVVRNGSPCTVTAQATWTLSE